MPKSSSAACARSRGHMSIFANLRICACVKSRRVRVRVTFASSRIVSSSAGPAPYHSDEQLEAAVEHLGRVAG